MIDKLQILILAIVIFFCNFSYAQDSILFNISTTNCSSMGDWQLNLKDKTVINVLNNAANYISAITGKQILKNNIFLNYCTSEQDILPVLDTINKRRIPLSVKTDISYHLEFFVVNEKDTLGFFRLFTNSHGKLLRRFAMDEIENQPQLILGFKKSIENEFLVSFSKAKEIAAKKGFKEAPRLNWIAEDDFFGNTNPTFVKVKYYWSFSKSYGTKGIGNLDIDAETGEIEEDFYTIEYK